MCITVYVKFMRINHASVPTRLRIEQQNSGSLHCMATPHYAIPPVLPYCYSPVHVQICTAAVSPLYQPEVCRCFKQPCAAFVKGIQAISCLHHTCHSAVWCGTCCHSRPLDGESDSSLHSPEHWNSWHITGVALNSLAVAGNVACLLLTKAGHLLPHHCVHALQSKSFQGLPLPTTVISVWTTARVYTCVKSHNQSPHYILPLTMNARFKIFFMYLSHTK